MTMTRLAQLQPTRCIFRQSCLLPAHPAPLRSSSSSTPDDDPDRPDQQQAFDAAIRCYPNNAPGKRQEQAAPTCGGASAKTRHARLISTARMPV